jgi:hypothetical protein
VAVKV